jgi:hypothetical protein|tara:strand:+ start:16744 stop:17352 length:609 start_codon:yes stop_codon:yes gene_type:complete
MNLAVRVKLNRSALRQEVAAQLPRVIGDTVKKDLYNKFLSIKSLFIKEFEKHPITEEVRAGASSPNISGILSGYGNLYSFFGFDEADPTSGVMRLLNEMQFSFTNFNRRQMASFRVQNFPTISAITEVTPLPWAPGLSWAYGVHRGNVPNFGNYLHKDWKGSRSGKGLQVPHEIESRSMSSDKTYIIGMLKTYNKLFRGITP